MRVLVASNHSIVRDGLVGILNSEPSFEAAGYRLRESDTSFDADVVLCAIISPLELDVDVPRIVQRHAPSKTLCLLLFEDDEAALAALHGGLQGIMDHDVGVSELLEGIRRAALGEFVVSNHLARRLVRLQTSKSAGSPSLQGSLTTREKEVLELLARGQTNREMGHALGVSEHTIRAHLRVITQKLGVSNRVQAAALVWKGIAVK
jgi:DNA-binding NarL/FixJ family response regulator